LLIKHTGLWTWGNKVSANKDQKDVGSGNVLRLRNNSGFLIFDPAINEFILLRRRYKNGKGTF